MVKLFIQKGVSNKTEIPGFSRFLFHVSPEQSQIRLAQRLSYLFKKGFPIILQNPTWLTFLRFSSLGQEVNHANVCLSQVGRRLRGLPLAMSWSGFRSPKMSPRTVRECHHDDCTTLGCSTFSPGVMCGEAITKQKALTLSL